MKTQMQDLSVQPPYLVFREEVPSPCCVRWPLRACIKLAAPMRDVELLKGASFPRTLPWNPQETDDNTTKLGKAVVNSLVMVAGILTSTVIFFYLYKFNCSPLLYGWL